MCTQYMHSVHACFKIPQTEEDKNTVIKSFYKLLKRKTHYTSESLLNCQF